MVLSVSTFFFLVVFRTCCKDKTLSFYGIVVLAAGISGHLVPAEMNPELRSVLEVNFFGNVRLIQLALPHLRQVKGSRIVVISSVTGVFPTGLMSSYCSSKFALEGFFNSLRRELYGRDISVSIINAGAIRTDIWNSIQDSTLMEKLQVQNSDYKDLCQNIDHFSYVASEGSDKETSTTPAILHALTGRFPSNQYFPLKFGKEPARLVAFAQWLIPARLFDWFADDPMFRLFKFRAPEFYAKLEEEKKKD